MRLTRHRRAGDTTGWLLATIIVVLAVLDLLIRATLWIVPNPISKFLVPQAAARHLSAAPAPFGGATARPVRLNAVPAAAASAFEKP